MRSSSRRNAVVVDVDAVVVDIDAVVVDIAVVADMIIKSGLYK